MVYVRATCPNGHPLRPVPAMGGLMCDQDRFLLTKDEILANQENITTIQTKIKNKTLGQMGK